MCVCVCVCLCVCVCVCLCVRVCAFVCVSTQRTQKLRIYYYLSHYYLSILILSGMYSTRKTIRNYFKLCLCFDLSN